MAGQNPITSGQITSGQRDQLLALTRAAISRAYSGVEGGKELAQNVIVSGDQFQDDIVASLFKHSVPNMYAGEEIQSLYTYPPDYKYKPVDEQVRILREIFGFVSSLHYSVPNISSVALPEGAQGWFAIPRWEIIASNYDKAVKRIFEINTPKLFFFTHHMVGNQNLRMLPETKKALKLIGEMQRGYDILLIPAQFGSRHLGQSARRVRALCRPKEEFGLCTFAAAIMILTHPERMGNKDDLEIDCAGDEYRNGPDAKQYTFTPRLSCGERTQTGRRGIMFNAWPFGSYGKNRGSITGFMPKQYLQV